MVRDPDPEHALFAGLGGAMIRALSFTRGATARDHVVMLALDTLGGVRTFRFIGVPELRLGNRFPEIGWLLVQDARARQFDNLRVHVLDAEQTDGIEFWAADVEEIPTPVALLDSLQQP